MIKPRNILILALFLLSAFQMAGQELNCMININTQKLEGMAFQCKQYLEIKQMEQNKMKMLCVCKFVASKMK